MAGCGWGLFIALPVQFERCWLSALVQLMISIFKLKEACRDYLLSIGCHVPGVIMLQGISFFPSLMARTPEVVWGVWRVFVWSGLYACLLWTCKLPLAKRKRRRCHGIMPAQQPFCGGGWSKMLQCSENLCQIFVSLGLCDVLLYLVPFGDDSYNVWGDAAVLVQNVTRRFSDPFYFS